MNDDGWWLFSAGWPFVPDGWRELIETACRRLDGIARTAGQGEIAIIEIEERRGSLRMVVSSVDINPAAREAVDLAVDLAEARAEQSCSVCGGRARRWWAWAPPLCYEHGEGPPEEERGQPGIMTIFKFVDGQAHEVRRTYLFDEDRFVSEDRGEADWP
jgi:hypothetical protein